MLSKCWSELFNLIAAVATLVGSGISAFVLWVIPEPTGLTKAAAVGATIATIGAFSWVISALIALIDCLEESGEESDRLNELRDELRLLQERLEELEGN